MLSAKWKDLVGARQGLQKAVRALNQHLVYGAEVLHK